MLAAHSFPFFSFLFFLLLFGSSLCVLCVFLLHFPLSALGPGNWIKVDVVLKTITHEHNSCLIHLQRFKNKTKQPPWYKIVFTLQAKYLDAFLSFRLWLFKNAIRLLSLLKAILNQTTARSEVFEYKWWHMDTDCYLCSNIGCIYMHNQSAALHHHNHTLGLDPTTLWSGNHHHLYVKTVDGSSPNGTPSQLDCLADSTTASLRFQTVLLHLRRTCCLKVGKLLGTTHNCVP